MANINQILISGATYDIEAKHFYVASTLDTPTHWKNYIDNQVATAAKIQLVVDSWNSGKTAPNTTASASTMGKIYLCANEGTLSGIYTEFVTIDNGASASTRYTWEKIGTTATDLSSYAKIGTYTSTATAPGTDSKTTGITVTSSGGHTTSAATFTGKYSKSAATTGQNETVSTSGTTGDGGKFSVTPTFSGTAATLSGNVTGASINSVSYTPAGGITGSQTIDGHTHKINAATTTQGMLTGASTKSDGAHTHTVDSHTHDGSGTASVISAFSGGSITSAGTITAVKSVSPSLSTKNYGFAATTTALTAAAVTGTLLYFNSATAGTQDALSCTTTTATVNTGYTHTAASITYAASAAFAKAATNATLTTSSDGSHTHGMTLSSATITYVTGATMDSAGGATVEGTNFKFTGTAATIAPTVATAGSVSISYTPAGTISAVSIGNHTHSYNAPVAHTHSITLTSTDIAVSGTVAVSNHTHTLSDPGHSHTVDSHTHNVTITNP